MDKDKWQFPSPSLEPLNVIRFDVTGVTLYLRADYAFFDISLCHCINEHVLMYQLGKTSTDVKRTPYNGSESDVRMTYIGRPNNFLMCPKWDVLST